MNGMLPLLDIKPLIDIADYSLYYFLSLAFMSFLAFVLFVYFLYNVIMFYKNKKNNLKNLLKKIVLLDINNSKKFAYEWTKHTNQIQGEFKKLEITKYLSVVNDMIEFSNSLELYKYKSKSDELDDDTRNQFSKLREKIIAISI